MDFITPLISILPCMIEYVFKRATTAENLDQRVHNLDRALEELIEVRDDLQKEVDRAVSKGLTLSSQVNGWLARVDEAVDEVRVIREEMDEKKQCLFCCWTKCLSRYELRKRVGEEVERVKDLIAKGKGKLEVGLPDGLLLVPVVEIPSRAAVGLDLVLERVESLLREEHVWTIGLYGMGGVGKTTLLRCINNGFLSWDHDFDVVIWAVVSRDFVVEKIQQAIGARLGLSWDEAQFQELRASRIYSIMRRKKFLLLLDDVWKAMISRRSGSLLQIR